MGVKIVSENYFKYDSSDYAASLRKLYGEDGYKKYARKMNCVLSQEDTQTTEGKFTNPIAESKQKRIKEKASIYKQALANKSKAQTIWNHFDKRVAANLEKARKQNNGFLTSELRRNALLDAGDGAEQAYKNLASANSNVDEALSNYFDATHSGLSVGLLS